MAAAPDRPADQLPNIEADPDVSRRIGACLLLTSLILGSALRRFRLEPWR